MKRFGIAIIGAFVLLYTAMMAGATPVSIVNSKHDLSVNSTGATIKSGPTATGGTGEICVFCHTPHSAAADAPLWNRSYPNYASITPYTSDVMSALAYTGDSSLASHVKTRICLACHDGTVAMGSLVNLPYGLTDPIPISGTTGGYMPTTAAGYIGIGTELQDDHPVAITHSTGLDPELQTPSSVIKLYSGYIECTSCHNAHDNQYGNFLVMSNQYSAICTNCHIKKNFGSSIHDSSSQAYSPTTGAPTSAGTPTTLGSNVGQVKCMNCHFPHKAGVLDTAKTSPVPSQGVYLLSFKEEQSCFNTNNDRWNTSNSNTVCHGTSASASEDIEDVSPTTKSYGHNIKSYTGVHQAAEARTFPWSGTKHVECGDCHNPHTAGNASPPHTQGTNTVSSNLPIYGAGGAGVTSWPGSNWGTSFTYVYREPIGLLTAGTNTGVIFEYEICFKCHSSANQNLTTWNGNWTNAAQEFNPNNSSYHPVASSSSNTYGTYVSPWTNGSQTMYCSDCHGNDNVSEAKGPHGSGKSAILTFTSFLTSYSSVTTGAADDSSGDLCSQCHTPNVYYSGTNTPGSGFETSGNTNLHNSHKNKQNGFAYRCVNCHTKIPHGYTRRGMVVVSTDSGASGDAAMYAVGGSSGAKITSFSQPAPHSYPTTTGAGTCGTVAGCH